MQHLISSYLFTQRYCVLPGIGALTVHHRSAAYTQGEQQMYPPETEIDLMESNADDPGFIRYASGILGGHEASVRASLQQFCDEMKTPFKETVFPSIGTFTADEDGNISFSRFTNEAVLPEPVPASRVIRKESHTLVVGDKESSSEVMTAYYAEQNTTGKKGWWLWALVLFLIATFIITYYFISGDYRFGFGSKEPVTQPATFELYKSNS